MCSFPTLGRLGLEVLDLLLELFLRGLQKGVKGRVSLRLVERRWVRSGQTFSSSFLASDSLSLAIFKASCDRGKMPCQLLYTISLVWPSRTNLLSDVNALLGLLSVPITHNSRCQRAESVQWMILGSLVVVSTSRSGVGGIGVATGGHGGLRS